MEADRKTFQWSHTTPKSNNPKDVSYPTSDIGSSYDTDISFSVGVYDGLTQSTFTNKKDYIDENKPAVFYNMSIVTTSSYGGKTYTNTTGYTTIRTVLDLISKGPGQYCPGFRFN